LPGTAPRELARFGARALERGRLSADPETNARAERVDDRVDAAGSQRSRNPLGERAVLRVAQVVHKLLDQDDVVGLAPELGGGGITGAVDDAVAMPSAASSGAAGATASGGSSTTARRPGWRRQSVTE
jgi:hypothetical protein